MKILYISSLLALNTSGPAHSVPASIHHQSKYDDVYWIDINDTSLPEWEKMEEYHCIAKKERLSLDILPVYFQRPDLVIFEQVYYYCYIRFAKELRKNKIPYIIIPRCSLTYLAQSLKSIKKRIANFLFFNKFIKKSLAIQYLTKKEYEDSNKLFPTNYFILPNGFSNENNIKKQWISNVKDGLNGVYIGRIDIFHKGLDLLVESCYQIKDVLLENKFHINIYGPDYSKQYQELENLIKKKNLEEIIYLKKSIIGEKKVEVLLNADFFIMTSRFEGLPMGVLEALSYGIPVIVSDGTNIKSEIEEYDAGWGCETNTDSIKNTILQLIKEKDKLYSKSENAHKLACNYNWNTIAFNFHNIVTEYLKEVKV